MATAFDDREYDVHLVAPEPASTLSDVYESLTIHTVSALLGRFDGQLARAITLSRRASEVCENQDATLLVNQASLAGVASLVTSTDMVVDMADLAFPSPVYSGMRFEFVIRRAVRSLERRATEYADLVFPASRPLSKFITDEWNADPNRVKTIYNGYFESDLDWTEYREPGGEGIGYVSSFGPKSDLEKILSVAASTEEPVTIIGDGNRRDEMEQRAERDGISNLEFTGFLPYRRAVKELSTCRVGLVPLDDSLSTRMSCPVKTFDYAMTGCAIVGDNTTEMIRRFAANNAALASDPNDRSAFVRNALELLEDDEMYKQLTTNARSMVKDEFSRENQGQRAVDRYELQFGSNSGRAGETATSTGSVK